MANTKPGDETIRVGASNGPPKKTDPEMKITTDSYKKHEDGDRALGENMAGTTGSHKKITAEAAPEVSQGAWRERVFAPRALMGRAEMLAALQKSITVAEGRVGSAAPVFEGLRREWIPVLRQAVEQAGGDGFDGWLSKMLKPPGKNHSAKLVEELSKIFERMQKALTVESLVKEARQVIAVVDQHTQGSPKKLSFKVMERELEGKLEVHELLMVLFSDPLEIETRLKEIGSTLESIRAQLKATPGAKPDGLYSNFGRLKAEARVLTAELARRKQG